MNFIVVDKLTQANNLGFNLYRVLDYLTQIEKVEIRFIKYIPASRE